jgi:ATP-binding cassette subfamily B protein
MTARQHSDFQIYRRLLLQARPYWLHISGILVLSLLSTPLALMAPLPLKILVDNVLGSRPLPAAIKAVVPRWILETSSNLLFFSIVLLLIIMTLAYLRSFGSALLETYTGERLVLRFRAELLHRVQHISLAYHDHKGVMDSLYRIQYDAPAIQWVAVNGVIPFITATVTVLSMMYVIARIDWQLALVAALVAPVLFGITHLFRRRIRDGWSRVKAIQSSAISGVQEGLSALRVVKAFGQEERERQRFVRESERTLEGQLRLVWINGGFDGLVAFCIAAGTATTLFIGVRHVEAGVLSLGSLLLITGYLSQLYAPLQEISKKIGDLQASLVGAERSFALLDQEPDPTDHSSARAITHARGTVTFQKVCFSYPNGPEVLHDICLEVAPGDRIGIMGPTGSGKTTFVSLLMRLYDPTKGGILLDGIDLREIRLSDLRRQFSIVLQEPILFSTSVAENIAYARPSATNEEIVFAARLADAHEFITRLPQGYETSVGERGTTISGGERQRIALARAFLRDAPILILDEPTSSVDLRTEASIVEALEKLMHGRTTFIIAHRVSTLRNCNVQLAFEDGRLRGWEQVAAGIPIERETCVWPGG